MKSDLLFTENFKSTPYWWDESPRLRSKTEVFPQDCEVLVIGSGYTGLHAAIQTARAGKKTVIIDSYDAGFGCSTRNGGQISTSIKPSFKVLSNKFGKQRAKAIHEEGITALKWIEKFVTKEGIDCSFKVVGRFHGAHTPKKYADLLKEIKNQPKGLERRIKLITKEQQYSELGTDAYYGGIVFEDHASIDPGKYHNGLLQIAKELGVTITENCRADSIENSGQFIVTTQKGKIKTNSVIVATNGYSGNLIPWLKRRIIPVGSYVIATEPLPKDLMDKLMPRDRILSDTRKVVYYYRPSPDRTRIIFGGRVTSGETGIKTAARLLHKDLCSLFPELNSKKISHAWMGFVGYTFDSLAHCGEYKGIHFSGGYCGSGVSMASYLGMRIGKKIIGDPEGFSVLSSIPFPTRIYYQGNPWFLSTAVAGYRLLDQLRI